MTSDIETGADADTTGGMMVTGPTMLSCPNPGDLPFTLESSAFNNNQDAFFAEYTRNKNEAHDIVANPGGPWLRTNMPLDSAPFTDTAVVYEGRKAASDSGLLFFGISNENVSAWMSNDLGEWSSVGRTLTDSNGLYTFSVQLTDVPEGLSQQYAILEGDGTCEPHTTGRPCP